MKELKIKIREDEFTIKQSFRTFLLYEEMTGKQVTDIETIKDVLNLLYCTFKGCNKNWNYTFDEFLDIVDEQPEIFEQFNKFNASTTGKKK